MQKMRGLLFSACFGNNGTIFQVFYKLQVENLCTLWCPQNKVAVAVQHQTDYCLLLVLLQRDQVLARSLLG